MPNRNLNSVCIILVDQIFNGDPTDRSKEDLRSVKPEGLEGERRFNTPCCDYMLQHIGHFKEVYDGHIGLEFKEDDEEYFEDYSNCPFCGSPVSYVIRKKFNMVPDKTGSNWVKMESQD
jgi:hypothetical protein